MYSKPDPVIKTVTIDGIDVPIKVTESGVFHAIIDEERFEAPSLKGLQEKLKKHIRTAKRIAIPATLMEENTVWGHGNGPDRTQLVVKQITLTGMHGRTGRVLYREDKSGDTGQISHYNAELYRRLTEEEVQEIFRLRKVKRAADEALETYLEERKIHGRTTIEKAQAAIDPETADVDGTPAAQD